MSQEARSVNSSPRAGTLNDLLSYLPGGFGEGGLPPAVYTARRVTPVMEVLTGTSRPHYLERFLRPESPLANRRLVGSPRHWNRGSGILNSPFGSDHSISEGTPATSEDVARDYFSVNQPSSGPSRPVRGTPGGVPVSLRSPLHQAALSNLFHAMGNPNNPNHVNVSGPEGHPRGSDEVVVSRPEGQNEARGGVGVTRRESGVIPFEGDRDNIGFVGTTREFISQAMNQAVDWP